MSELYGIKSELVGSRAQTPVTIGTEIVFIGSSEKAVDGAVKLTKMADFTTKFGSSGSLLDGAMAAFTLENIDHAYFISTQGRTFEEALVDVDGLFLEYGVIPTIICVPTIMSTTENVQAALVKASKVAGHYKAQVIYDVEGNSNQVVNGHPVIAEIAPNVRNEAALAVWGSPAYISSGSPVAVSGAAVVACRRARQDAENEGGLPSRSVGNLEISWCACVMSPNSVKVLSSEDEATELSYKGIITFLNQGSNRYTTWGDHTSAFNSGTVADERARFDNQIAMSYHIANRFIAKWKDVIDDAMSLSLRNDIIAEENDYLAYCVLVNALVGSPKCEFRPVDNTADTLAKGEFYFTNDITHTRPTKFLDLKIQYSDDGLSAYVID